MTTYLRLCVAIAMFWLCTSTHAAVITWNGDALDGLWTSGNNWDGNAVPLANDDVIINNGDVISVAGLLPSANLPADLSIMLSGGSELNSPVVVRLNGANLNVAAGSRLTGSFWDLNNGSLTFDDGAIATMSNWEQKGTNFFTFVLGPTGFTTLTPFRFRFGGGATIADATYVVDMSAFTGGTGVIPLADFGLSGTMNDATFQGAGGLNVINAGDYVANLQWNDVTRAIELNVTAVVPEPGMPSVSSGTKEPVHAALLAVSGAASPLIEPFPNSSCSAPLAMLRSTA